MVKLFHQRRHDDLEQVVQAFLDANPNLRVVGMTSSSVAYGHTVTLVCEPAGVPQGYRFSTFFAGVGFTGTSVDRVEEEADQWLQDGMRLVQVAQSQNDAGLFLALLAETEQ